ncbi:hypothetical protein [Dyadobacter fermentans]|uniref:Toxin n=1 Tax=Dyadobacter fermentans (strain ATCC 700827 / DSM 18053 / CIP 107007 / KCTC 52180 / NS114) TaxID=471854 RepID=C6VTF6_DYAFD|nr:hypothetical protein [Dyadobacter fermentans]ACT96520.1 conserved hypothetical protein [Dyadobacter fermentans DSM 18053]
MPTRHEVQRFLDDFFVKYRIFDILFIERKNPKNAETLLRLEISTAKRRQIIEAISTDDYVEGPLADTLYQCGDMWFFGRNYHNHELYIKISMGRVNSNVLCISFHEAERTMEYPFKKSL